MSDTTFQEIPLARLHESPMNPRKHFDPKKLEELIASIKANGIRTPLLVRPNAQGFEIGAGHRRYRAAKAAGVDLVPVIVRPMKDAEFLELLNFENLEREDIHPLEEAEGYRILMDKAGHDVASIAARVGKSVAYVYDRVKLLALTKAARKLFLDGRITAGHAILLARLPAKDQARAIDPNDHGALFTREASLSFWDPDEPDDRRALREADPYLDMKPVSVRELQAWIDQHVKFDRAAADPMLFPETVGAVTAATETAEKVVQITHNHYVQEEARDAKERIYGPSSWKRAKKPCDKTITGVIVVGPGRGEALKVCLHKECKVHWAAELRERAKRAVSTSRSTASAGETSWQREAKKRQAERARADAENARWKKALPQLLEAVAAAVKKAPAKANGLLGSIVLESFNPGIGHKDYSGAHVPRGTTAEDLVRHCAFQVLQDELQEWGAPADFPKRAKAFGLDVRKIVDEVAPAAKPEKTALQTSGKKKAKK